MIQPDQQSSQRSSEKSPSSHSKVLLHHVLNNVLRITTDERVSFSKWMENNHYHNIHELCEILIFGLEDLYECSDYIVDGQHCALESSTMNTTKVFISWMLTKMKGNTFQLSSHYYLCLHIKISMSSSKEQDQEDYGGNNSNTQYNQTIP